MAIVAKTDKVICPHCKIEMNHHCDKIVYNFDANDAGRTDACLAGMVEEFHSCPQCGGAASRHA